MKQAHICLDETLGVRYAILPGDPARLDRVAAQLESVRELAYNREFRSLTGTYKGVPVLAVSTGIGGSSAGICVEELHNIGVEAAIRIGSCGALQKGIALGDLILGCGAIRDDGASKAYVHPEYPAVADYQLLGLCVDAAKAIGCLNFFAGPPNSQFKAEFNWYNVHYLYTHVVGTSGGNTSDMKEAIEMMTSGKINPAAMITHIGGLNAVVDTVLNLPKIPGGKKLIYTQIELPLTAIADFGKLGETDPLFAKLDEITKRHNGLWSAEAEKYLLANK